VSEDRKENKTEVGIENKPEIEIGFENRTDFGLEIENETEIRLEDITKVESENQTQIQTIENQTEVRIKEENTSWGYVLLNIPVRGLGDRVRAIIQTYYIALLMNRTFKIDGQAMFGSEDGFFDVNLENWRMSEEERKVIESPSTTRIIETIGYHNWKEKFQTIDFESYKNVQVISFETNVIEFGSLERNSMFKKSPKYEFFRDLVQNGTARSYALKSLFKPGKKVMPHLENFQRDYWPTNDTLKIGIHLRSGDNGRLTSNSRRKRGRFVTLDRAECFATKALSVWEDEKNGYKNVIFFVTADLVDFEEAVVKKIESQGHKIFRNNNLGEAKHLDKSKADQLRTFVDWWTLTKMDIMILPHSGYSEAAVTFSQTRGFMFPNDDQSSIQSFTPIPPKPQGGFAFGI